MASSSARVSTTSTEARRRRGIELVPRIRSWKKFDLCRPDRSSRYEHIDRKRNAGSRILGLVPDAGIAAASMRGKEIRVDTAAPIETVELGPATITDSSPVR